jgi:hypothetical protein
MAIGLDDERWPTLDEGILRREILTTLKAIRAAAGVSLKEAIDIYHERYKILRKSRPGEFTCDDEAYWEGVYS